MWNTGLENKKQSYMDDLSQGVGECPNQTPEMPRRVPKAPQSNGFLSHSVQMATKTMAVLRPVNISHNDTQAYCIGQCTY